jgi:hypothetical protein
VQIRQRDIGKLRGFQTLYSKEIELPANAFSIFSGEWSTAVPGFETGKSQLFNDDRMKWTLGELDSLHGKRVLELGTLEGRHKWDVGTRRSKGSRRTSGHF